MHCIYLFGGGAMYCGCFETGSHKVVQDDLELTLPQAGLKLVTIPMP